MTIRVEPGDCLEVMARLIAEGVVVQSIVTDPPYHLTSIVKRFGGDDAAPAKVGKTGAYARASRGFMGKQWDGGDIAFQVATWKLCFDLLPPGGHLIAFGGTRTYHRMACASSARHTPTARASAPNACGSTALRSRGWSGRRRRG